MKPEHKPQQKKRYSKPRLRTIKLAADEVLATDARRRPPARVLEESLHQRNVCQHPWFLMRGLNTCLTRGG